MKVDELRQQRRRWRWGIEAREKRKTLNFVKRRSRLSEWLAIERRTTNIQAKLFSFYVKSRRQTFLCSRFHHFEVTRWPNKKKKRKWRKTQTYGETSTLFPFSFCSQEKRDENQNYLFRDLWLSSRHWMVELRVTVSYKRPAGTREHQMAIRLFLCEQIVTNVCRSIDSLATNKAVKTTDLWPFVSNFTFLSHRNRSLNSINEKSNRSHYKTKLQLRFESAYAVLEKFIGGRKANTSIAPHSI